VSLAASRKGLSSALALVKEPDFATSSGKPIDDLTTVAQSAKVGSFKTGQDVTNKPDVYQIDLSSGSNFRLQTPAESTAMVGAYL